MACQGIVITFFKKVGYERKHSELTRLSVTYYKDEQYQKKENQGEKQVERVVNYPLSPTPGTSQEMHERKSESKEPSRRHKILGASCSYYIQEIHQRDSLCLQEPSQVSDIKRNVSNKVQCGIYQCRLRTGHLVFSYFILDRAVVNVEQHWV